MLSLLNFYEALDSLSSNKLRSALTVLGIVIGVGAVIGIMAVGTGAQNAITGQISAIGTNLMFVFRGGNEDIRNPKPLTEQDAQAIADPFAAPSVVGVAPVVQQNLELTNAGQSTFALVIGVTSSHNRVLNLALTEGDFISEANILERASVAVIGPDAADTLFGRKQGVVGETFRIESQPFRVIGVLASRGGSGFGNQDNQVMVPLTTAQTRLFSRGLDRVDMIIVKASSPEAVPEAEQEVSNILRARHRTPIGADDFTILTQEDFLTTAGTITNVLTLFLGGIAGISLLVGGIGIMNIMLVSVTERTREIGLRKAVGARKRDILFQFLTESSMLSLAGGVIGIGLGWALSLIVGAIAAASNTDLTPAVTLNAVLLATLFSAGVGLFFGLYPAKRAADLEPVEALRYE
jgi:putative ABC transport system permease protein